MCPYSPRHFHPLAHPFSGQQASTFSALSMWFVVYRWLLLASDNILHVKPLEYYDFRMTGYRHVLLFSFLLNLCGHSSANGLGPTVLCGAQPVAWELLRRPHLHPRLALPSRPVPTCRPPAPSAQVFDDAPQRLYEALYALMSSLLCDPATSPFLLEPAHTPVQGRSSSCGEGPATRGHAAVVITSPRPLLAGLACLGAHEDLAQRTLVLVSEVGVCCRDMVLVCWPRARGRGRGVLICLGVFAARSSVWTSTAMSMSVWRRYRGVNLGPGRVV